MKRYYYLMCKQDHDKWHINANYFVCLHAGDIYKVDDAWIAFYELPEHDDTLFRVLSNVEYLTLVKGRKIKVTRLPLRVKEAK